MAKLISDRLIICILIFFLFLLIKFYLMTMYIALLEWVEIDKSPINSTIETNATESNSMKLNWDPSYVKYIQSAYFAGTTFTKIPSGLIMRRYGPRKVLIFLVFTVSCLSLLIPTSAKIHPILTGIVQLLLGATCGIHIPVVYLVASYWVPKSDRAKFMVTFQGWNIGGIIGYPMHGYILVNFGWEYMFYVNTILGLVWLIFCWRFIYDTPIKHPRISSKEKEYILRELEHVNFNKTYPVPWKSLFTSMPVWALIFATQGSILIGITLSFQLPRYFSQVHHLGIQTNTMFLGIVSLVTTLCCFIVSPIMDALVNHNIFSVTVCRKIAVAIGHIGSPLFLLGVHFWGANNQIIALIFLCIVLTLDAGTSSAGQFANAADIAPNFSSVLSGIIYTTNIIPGSIFPIIIGFILADKHTAAEWFTVFVIIDVFVLTTCVIFLIFGSGEVQAWNEPPEEPAQNDNEMKLLQNNKVLQT